MDSVHFVLHLRCKNIHSELNEDSIPSCRSYYKKVILLRGLVLPRLQVRSAVEEITQPEINIQKEVDTVKCKLGNFFIGKNFSVATKERFVKTFFWKKISLMILSLIQISRPQISSGYLKHLYEELLNSNNSFFVQY